MKDRNFENVDLPPGPELDRFVRRIKRWYFVCTLLSRLYMTLLMAMFAVLGAESLPVAWVMVGLGLAMDLVRNLVAPDLNAPISRVAAELTAAQTPDPPLPSSRPLTQLKVLLHVILPVYLLVLIIAEYIAGSDGLRGYLTLFSPLHDLASSAMSIIRRHGAKIQELGHMDRALFVTHLYAFFGFYVVSSGFLISLIMYKVMLYSHKVDGLEGKKTTMVITKAAKHSILVIFTLIIISFVLNVIEIGGQARLPWRVDISNLPFLWFIGSGWLATLLIFLLHLVLIKMRASLWVVLEGATSPRSVNRLGEP